MRRRPFIVALPWLAAAPAALGLPERRLVFPADHGAHPEMQTEWWYITGSAEAGGRRFGFQVTFFRSRVDATRGMQSRFAAKQLLFAHAALTDVAGRRLWHDQRIARQGFGIAEAATGDADLRLRDWSLVRDGAHWLATVPAGEFTLALRCEQVQPALLQGSAGLSRKGPQPEQASYYYSLPQLRVSGRIALHGKPHAVTGTAWMDHEWSEALMHPEAMGWDWIGMNLDDGGALTAFQLRRKDGSALWDGGSWRGGGGALRIARQGETVFSAQRHWTSPLSNATYPVQWSVRTPAGVYTVRPVLDDQELDSRASTGAIYWEGLSDLLDASGRTVGRGYLEMTGYAQRLRL